MFIQLDIQPSDTGSKQVLLKYSTAHLPDVAVKLLINKLKRNEFTYSSIYLYDLKEISSHTSTNELTQFKGDNF